MGRFYKSSKGNYLDFMYQQPTNLLLKAQQVADQSLSQQEIGYNSLYENLKMNKLSADDELSKKIISDYEGIIDEKTTDLRENSLKYINNPKELTKVSKEIWKDKTRGNWAAIESNYSTRQAFKEKLDAQVKAHDNEKGGGITQAHADELLNNFDAKFSQYGTKGEKGDMSGTYKTGFISDAIIGTYEVDKAMTGVNINTFAMENGLEVIEEQKGQYSFLRAGSTKVLSDPEVKNIIIDYINANETINSYFSTRQRQNISGFKTDEEILAKKNALLDYGVSKYAYTEEKVTTKNLSNPSTGVGSDGSSVGNNSSSTSLEITNQTGAYVPVINSDGTENKDAFDAKNNPISGTYSGTIENIGEEATDLIEYDQTLDIKHEEAKNIVSSTLGPESGVNYDTELFEAKNESQRTGNWDNYKKAVEKVNEDYAVKALAKWEADNDNKTTAMVSSKTKWLKENKLINLTDNDIAQFEKYNENSVTIRENNVAKLKGLVDRTNNNLASLDKIKNNILANNSEYDILTDDYPSAEGDPGDLSQQKKTRWRQFIDEREKIKASLKGKDGYWRKMYMQVEAAKSKYNADIKAYEAGFTSPADQEMKRKKENLQKQFHEEMQKAVKGNSELQKLLFTDIVSKTSFEEQYLDAVGPQMNSAYSNISQTFTDPAVAIDANLDYEGASKWLNDNLFGTTVNYLNQNDNVNKLRSVRTNTPTAILISAVDSNDKEFVNDQTKKGIRTWLHNRVYDGKKISIDKVKDNLGTSIRILANQYNENSPIKSILTNFDNITQDMITEQVAVKEVAKSGEVNILTDEAKVNTIAFVSNGVPVNFHISSPMITETVIEGQPGMYIVYDIEIGVAEDVTQYYNKDGIQVGKDSSERVTEKDKIVPGGTVKKHTITQSLGPNDKSGDYQAMTDLISPQRYHKHVKEFSQTSPFSIAGNTVESQTRNNASSNLIMKVPGSTYVDDRDNKKYMTVTKVKNKKAEFYIVPYQPLSNFTDHAELDKLITGTVDENYKDKISPASIQGISAYYTDRTNFVD